MPVTVRVAGNYYSTINNGNGTWTLPKGSIVPPLMVGTYDVLATSIDVLGNAAFDTITNELVINTPALTVSIDAVAPNPRVRPVDSIAIHFSEPVAGFNLADLQLTFGGVSQSLAGATLTSTDQQNWTLGNLTAGTSPVGDYQLTLAAAGSGITDMAGNALSVGANVAWQNYAPLPGDANLDGIVGQPDLSIVLGNFGKPGAIPGQPAISTTMESSANLI